MADYTQEDLNTCRDVLQAVLDDTREKEPWATNSIRGLEAALDALPVTVDED